jgi:glycosyltransferase involved in cell wall biosynthesis
MSETDVGECTIGICAKNEASTIYQCLESVRTAINQLDIISLNFAICLDSCNDGTGQEVERFINDNKNVEIKVYTGNFGLVEAQRMIVNDNPADVYVFVDADCKLREDSIIELLRPMRNNAEIKLTYGKTITINGKNEGLVAKVNQLYYSQKMLKKRYYFHGRIFATRVWELPPPIDVEKRAKKYAPHLMKYGSGTNLLAMEDVYLSTLMWGLYGTESIYEAEKAKVYAWANTNYKDWRESYRKTFIEVEKIIKWFPEFKEYKKLHFRKTNWQAWFRASNHEKLQWLFYLLNRVFFRFSLFLEIQFLKLPLMKFKEQWLQAQTTKKQFKDTE